MSHTSNMYICICNGVTESHLKDTINQNEIVCMTELREHGVCDTCTKCFDSALGILKECVDDRFKNEEWYISTKDNRHWEINIS